MQVAARGLSIRQRLTLIVLAVAIPMLLLLAGIVWWLAHRESEKRRDAMLYASHAILSAVDAQLGKYMTVAQMLAASPSLQRDDLASFREEAARGLPGMSRYWVVLADARGQQVFNTLVSAEGPLPPVASKVLPDEIRAFQTKQVQISDLISGPAAKMPAIVVGAPVFHAGAPAYYLMIGVDVTVFRDLLYAQHVPKGWLPAIIDRQGNFIVRFLHHERFVGKPASAGWRAVMQREGVFEFPWLEGRPITHANTVSPLSGWAIGISVHNDVFEAPIRQTVLVASLVGLAVTLSSMLLAAWAARRIALPIKTLETAAQTLRRGEPASFAATGVPEVDHALAAFDTACKTLRIEEQRRRAIVETAVDAIVVIDQDGIVQSFNPAAERIFGYQANEIVGKSINLLMPEPQRRAHDGHIRAYLKTGVAKIIGIGREEVGQRKDGTTLPIDLAVAEWRDGDKRFFTAIMRDITARKQAEERIQLVMRELSHRTKNLLAVVQTIAWKTARTSIDLKDFEERFAKRVAALARSHELLIEGNWDGVALKDLVCDQLHLFGADEHLDVDGPDLVLKPASAQTLGLALHELATNAAKFGALTCAAGRIEVTWSVDLQDDASGQFRMCWRETGGPKVSAPGHKGFGHTVIKDMTERALNGEVALEFPPEGLVWHFTAPAIAALGGPPSVAD
jgi:PAS domain S-box-containing protein